MLSVSGDFSFSTACSAGGSETITDQTDMIINSKCGKKFILLLLIFLFITSICPAFSQSPSLESAQEKFENKEYDAAEEEITAVLEADSKNIEARKLLIQIEQIKKKEKAVSLTEIAILEINNLNFEKALELLKEAITLDPSNKQARELYISSIEVYEIEQESIEEKKRLEEEKQMAQVEVVEPAPQLVEGDVLPDIEKPADEAAIKPRNRLFIEMAPTYTFARSNALDYIDSDVSMLGLKLDSRFYFLLQRRLGFSFDYSGNFIKTSGDDSIKFLVHRLNVSTRFRLFLFETPNSSLTAGARIGYHLFYLQNQLSEGAYNFKSFYAPSYGIFLKDPVIYRFVKKKTFQNLGFEGQADILLIPGQGEEALLSSIEFYLGSFYNLRQFRFSLGYRQYKIMQQPISESYHDIEVSVGYSYN